MPTTVVESSESIQRKTTGYFVTVSRFTFLAPQQAVTQAACHHTNYHGSNFYRLPGKFEQVTAIRTSFPGLRRRLYDDDKTQFKQTGMRERHSQSNPKAFQTGPNARESRRTVRRPTLSRVHRLNEINARASMSLREQYKDFPIPLQNEINPFHLEILVYQWS
jgi:hypothetical protein